MKKTKYDLFLCCTLNRWIPKHKIPVYKKEDSAL